MRDELELFLRIDALDRGGARDLNARGHDVHVRWTLRRAGSDTTLAETCAMHGVGNSL